jgi:5-methylcytosine-specific restriction endonuclease McrA
LNMKCSKHEVLIEVPHIQSLGALVLLTKRYRMDEIQLWLDFRDEFLSSRPLVCHYCKRDDLIKDQPEGVVRHVSNLATIDHVYPVSKGGPRYDPSNCVVSCLKCNADKADTILVD